MGSNTIVAIVVGAILVIVGFSLWPVLNGASNSLFSYFRDSCDDGNGNRFLKAYEGHDASSIPSAPHQNAYYTNLRQHGGRGTAVVKADIGSGCAVADDLNITGGTGVLYNEQGDVIGKNDTITTTTPTTATLFTSTIFVGENASGTLRGYSFGYGSIAGDTSFVHGGATYSFAGFNEEPSTESIYFFYDVDTADGTYSLLDDSSYDFQVDGVSLVFEAAGTDFVLFEGSSTFQWTVGDTLTLTLTQTTTTTSDSGTGPVIGEDFFFVEVAPMLERFAGINNLLLTILPVVSIAGFLGISGAKLYSYGKGTASIGSSISTSIFTLIGIVIAMVIAGPIMGAAVDANQVVVSGQYQVNGTFGNIIQLLFAMIPVVYIAGLVTLVGLQARTALLGGSGGGGGGGSNSMA